ncbi:MAG: type IX secretion system sortase PorU [Ignavibacteriae bacterium]|nr:type IX secretion system sortase PorU [Ignavibacteriota bacterium]
MNKYYLIGFLFFYSFVTAQDDYKILSSSSNSLIIEYTPSFEDTTLTIYNFETYRKTSIRNCEIAENLQGMPEVPKRVFNIGVPQEFGNNIRVINSDFKVLNGNLKPIPNMEKRNGFTEFSYKKSNDYNYYKHPEIIEFGEFGKIRDAQVQDIIVNPVLFDPVTSEIKFYTKIIFQIDFAQNSNQNRNKISEFAADVILNKEIAKIWGSEKKLSKISGQNSVLAEGEWYKFEAPVEGIYKIDKAYLTELGIPVNSIDPKTIKIYNNGGYILPWTISAVRPEDLVENAIFVSGEEDGTFGDNDYILFYGRGVNFWEFNKISNKITRNKNYYSNKNYYWITYGGTSGKRMLSQNNITDQPAIQQTSTKAYVYKDDDNQNLMSTGLLFVDDNYSSTAKTKTYTNMLNEFIPDSTINYNFQFINGAKQQNLLTIDENSTRIFSRLIAGAATDNQTYRYGAAIRSFATFKGTLPENRSALKFTFTPATISDKGHLDYFEIEYYKNLIATDNELLFFSKQIDGIVKFSGNNFGGSDFIVYNISDFSNPKIVNVEITGGNFTFANEENSNFSSKYLAVHSSKFKKPNKGVKETNSNIRGESQGAKYVIISPSVFKDQAERLKNYRSLEAQFPISSKVVFIEDIYKEFSGGMLDPTSIRDFLKYVYENWQIKPEYVLLFGDGDYDYLNIEEIGKNFIPSFQQIESLYEIDSYPYDDFYSRISGADEKADLGIGRLSITNTSEARIVVDKIISYETDQNEGLWRNRITLLGDDGLSGYNAKTGKVDDRDGSLHTGQSENLSNLYIPKSFDRKKIYLSNFQTINTGIGRRKPTCNAEIINAINNGTLIFNYFGHGSPDLWAHEQVFERTVSIPQLKNKELFFLTAATCDFGKYDDPNLQSATEEMILMENFGMIGGISAVRPVFSNENYALTITFYKHMLGSKDSLGFPTRIGNAYFKLKNERTGPNDERFHLFGDPALRLNIPKLPLKITSVNNSNLVQPVNISALSSVNISGKVLNVDSAISNFNGEAIITVFDSKRTIHLEDINYNMEDQGGVIFRGRVSVNNGEFSTSFTVPKDISYENKNGKISAYFFNEEFDGIGYTDNITIGGTDTTNTNDGKGPDIEILYDDELENSYLVNPNFKLRVKLFDETGLNTTGTGIGHKLEAILNDNEQNSIDLTNYFIGDLNSGGKSGEVNYNFSSLEPGEYKIKINAWDVFNNFSFAENNFTVVDGDKLALREVYNYPNPFSSNTFFTFQHNLSDAINVKIKIYTVAGRVIKEINASNVEDKFVKLEWDGKDEDNNNIGNGTYLYKLIVQSVDGEYTENILGKMAVIR